MSPKTMTDSSQSMYYIGRPELSTSTETAACPSRKQGSASIEQVGPPAYGERLVPRMKRQVD